MEYSIAIFNMDKFDFEIIERPNNIEPFWLTYRPKCMPWSRDTGVNIVNLTEILVIYGYVHWQTKTEMSIMYGSEKDSGNIDFRRGRADLNSLFTDLTAVHTCRWFPGRPPVELNGYSIRLNSFHPEMYLVRPEARLDKPKARLDKLVYGPGGRWWRHLCLHTMTQRPLTVSGETHKCTPDLVRLSDLGLISGLIHAGKACWVIGHSLGDAGLMSHVISLILIRLPVVRCTIALEMRTRLLNSATIC